MISQTLNAALAFSWSWRMLVSWNSPSSPESTMHGCQEFSTTACGRILQAGF